MEISEYTLSVSCCVLAMPPCSILLQTIIPMPCHVSLCASLVLSLLTALLGTSS